MGLHDADRLSRLNEQGFVTAQSGERANDRVVARPVAHRLAGTPVDHQLIGVLSDLRIEVVLQHPQGTLLLPTQSV